MHDVLKYFKIKFIEDKFYGLLICKKVNEEICLIFCKKCGGSGYSRRL
ncbi:unnamed protein product [Brassica rapa]|uniref:Uncharacterized protein n=1 Tax=Brassica campestris TaxID=3711 RepID=A0A3P5YGA6_BRACM|nr:unnamed protein product [Brassica rapa]VDC66772.1 unnamed protein product [Brassica rapa]